MAQIKIYALKSELDPIKARLSEVIHQCVVEALAFPPEKRFHRFFGMESDDFLVPANKGPRYTVLEISMMEGRSVETKKRLIRLLFERTASELGFEPDDLEITIYEAPKCNWGFRGLPGDEISLNYKVEV